MRECLRQMLVGDGGSRTVATGVGAVEHAKQRRPSGGGDVVNGGGGSVGDDDDEAAAAAAEKTASTKWTLQEFFRQLFDGADGAKVSELSCIVSDAGAPRQPLHPDMPWEPVAPIYSIFLALQDIDEPMGVLFVAGASAGFVCLRTRRQLSVEHSLAFTVGTCMKSRVTTFSGEKLSLHPQPAAQQQPR